MAIVAPCYCLGQSPNFTWQSGTDQLIILNDEFQLYGIRGNYGQKNIAHPNNSPGGRFSTAYGSSDSDLYVFGGWGWDKSTHVPDVLNDFLDL